MPRQAQKAKHWHGCKKAKNRGGGDIALQGKAFQKWRMIGNHQPCRKNQGQANTNVHSGADRRVAENVEPTITGQMRPNQHGVLGSQDPSNGLSRSYGDGCVTSTATGVPGALSFPARSTAVTGCQLRGPGSSDATQTPGGGDKTGGGGWPA